MIQHISIVALLIVLLVAVVLLGGPICLVIFGLRKALRGLHRGWVMVGVGLALLLVLLLPVAGHLYHGGPWHTRIVTQGVSSSGQEYCVVQAFQDLAEPYRISFYIRDNDGVWRWNYLDHQGYAWSSAHVEFRDEEALVFRNKELYKTILMPTGIVDIASVPAGYRNYYCPEEYTVEDVFRFHKNR